MKTKTVWVEVSRRQAVRVKIEVPMEMGNITAKEFAEARASELPRDSFFSGPRLESDKWDFFALSVDGPGPMEI